MSLTDALVELNVATKRTVPEAPDYSEFIANVSGFLHWTGWSMNKLAKSAGISPSALSQFISGQYPGDNEKVKTKIATVIERESAKNFLHKTSPNFIETSISARFFDIARAAHLYQEIGVCYSDAGLGKTESAREYTGRNPDTILIEADPGYTVSVLFKELHDRLGNGGHKAVHYLFEDCVHRLKGTGRLLIIDEAEQLSYKSLEMIRRLHDKSGIGVLLAGMHKLLGNLRGIRGEYAQLYSRVGMAVKLDPLKESDTRAIVSRLLSDATDFWHIFHRECAGNTRRLIKTINRTIHISDVNKCSIDEDVIVQAADMLKVEKMY